MALNTSIRGAQIKEAFAGDGLTISGGVMSVGVDGTTITIVGDALQANAGSIDHGGLIGIADDDHTQYSLADGTRAFTSTVSGVTPTVDAHLTTKSYVDSEITAATGSLTTDHGELTGLADDDHTQYSLADGTRAFTGTVSGVDPTETAHLTTKGYVDTAVGVSGAIDHGNLTGLADDDHTQYLLANGTRELSADWHVGDYDVTTSGAVGIGSDPGGFSLYVAGTGFGLFNAGETRGISVNQQAEYTDIWYYNGSSYTTPFAVSDTKGNLSVGFMDGWVGIANLNFGNLEGNLGTGINEFSIDGTLAGDSDSAVPTEKAVKAYVDSVSGTMDHGELEGLSDDDHTQYSLADGTRAFTGVVGGVTPTAVAHLTTKSYVDSLVQGLDWQESVLSLATEYGDAAASGTNRYIAPSSSGTWTDNYIYEWNVSAWDETIPTEGTAAWVEDEDALYVYNGTDWVAFGSTTNHNTLSGLQGGTANEYYHLTNTDYTWLVTNRQDNIEDLVGAMVSGNTETNIAVTYDDADPGKLDFVVDTATTSGLGVAQFSSDNFDVAAGVVTVKDEGIAEPELDINNAPTDGYYLQYDTTNGMQWADVTASGVTESDYRLENESANCNGATTAFTLDTAPISNSLQVYLNGLVQEKGAGKDYTHSGVTVTFVLAPLTNDILLIHYVAQS